MTLDPSPAYARGLEDVSGKNDTTQMTIAVLTGTSWILSENLGTSEPKCECACVQVIYREGTKKKCHLLGVHRETQTRFLPKFQSPKSKFER